jgi:MFS family permease
VSGNRAFYSWRYLTPLYMGSTLNPINSSMLATALVPIAAGLHVAIGSTAILVSSLYLASAIAQPTAGKLAEEFGPRRIFMIGIVLVGIGGVLGGLGHGLAELILARLLIGIGTSAGYPSAMLLIRRRAETAGLARPPGGCAWRAADCGNRDGDVWIPRDAPLTAARSLGDIAERIDLAGIAGFAAAASTLLGFLFSLPRPNWLELAAGIVLSAALVAWELRTSRPFIDFRLLAANGALRRTYLRFAMTTTCVYTVLYGLTQWLQAAGVATESRSRTVDCGCRSIDARLDRNNVA